MKPADDGYAYLKPIRTPKRTYWYVNKPPHRLVPLRADYGSNAFKAEYKAALLEMAMSKLIPKGRYAAGTFGHLVEDYLASSEYKDNCPKVRSDKRRKLDYLCELYGSFPLAPLHWRHIKKIRDNWHSTKDAANRIVKLLRVIFNYGEDVGLISLSPLKGKRKILHSLPETDGHHTWTEGEIAAFRSVWPIGSRERRAFELVLATGLRIEQLVTVGPANIRDGRLVYRAAKGGDDVILVIEGSLQLALNDLPKGEATFITKKRGGAYKPNSASTWFSAAARAAGMQPRQGAHGIRKTLATRLADTGANELTLMAVLGWKDTRSAARYTRKANRSKLGQEGLRRVYDVYEQNNA